MGNQTITAHILYYPNEVVEVDTLEVEVRQDVESKLWRPVSDEPRLFGGERWRQGPRYFDPMYSIDGIYLKLQATRDSGNNEIFKGLDFSPESFYELPCGLGFGNEPLPNKLHDIVQRDTDLTKRYRAMSMPQQQALLDALM